MLGNIILTLFLILYLVFAIYLTRLRPIKNLSPSLSQTLSPGIFLLLVISILFSTLMLVMYAPPNFTPWYLFITLSLSLIGFSRTYRFPFFIAVGLILARLITSNDIIHNFFIILSIAWLAPLLIHLKYLNRRRFIIISFLWFLYDIVFVWLTPTAGKILQSLSVIDFPLGLTFAGRLIGSGDLLWASLFLTLLPPKKRLLGATLLLFSYLALISVTNFITISMFPLLVLWVPLGVF
jgi:hypothetical protein